VILNVLGLDHLQFCFGSHIELFLNQLSSLFPLLFLCKYHHSCIREIPDATLRQLSLFLSKIHHVCYGGHLFVLIYLLLLLFLADDGKLLREWVLILLVGIKLLLLGIL
jgi:hypothetical protein